jgi:signal peptidase I
MNITENPDLKLPQSQEITRISESLIHQTFSEKKNPSNGIYKDFIIGLLEILILFAIINTVLTFVHVENISMEPTLKNGEYLIVNKYAYTLEKMKLGDIIVFNRPEDKNRNYIKRIIGLPGDEILIQNGTLFVNGKSVSEPYITTPPYYNGFWHVGNDEVFVLGDNRNISIDSHNWVNTNGILLKDIIGKAIILYWPINKIRIFI